MLAAESILSLEVLGALLPLPSLLLKNHVLRLRIQPFFTEETELPLEVLTLGTQDRSTRRRQCPRNPGQQFVLKVKWEGTQEMMRHMQLIIWALF